MLKFIDPPNGTFLVAATSDRPKTAALYFDYVVSAWENRVPSEINGLNLQACLTLAHARREWGSYVNRMKTTQGLVEIYSPLFRHDNRISFCPIYSGLPIAERRHAEGDRAFVASVISKLSIVDEEKLEWDQVLQFRNDSQATLDYRRLSHWFDREFIGKSESYVSEEIEARLYKYEQALRKHGVKTVTGELRQVVDWKTALAGGALGLAFPEHGLIAVGLLVAGRLLVSVSECVIDRKYIQATDGYDLSYLQDLRRLNS